MTLNSDSIDRYADSSDCHVIFIVPSDLEHLKMVKAFIESVRKKKITKEYHLIVYPKRTVMFQYMLRELELHFYFVSVVDGKKINKVHDFNFDLIPLNTDLLSLESKHTLHEMYVKKEFNSLNLVSQSLLKLQVVFGKTKAWFGMGENANEAIRIARRLEKQENSLNDKSENERSLVDGIIVFDRTVDQLTPVCTQFSYLG